jgi:catalase
MQKALLALAFTGALAYAQKPVMTTNGGVPVGDNQNSKTAGENGPVLLEDIHLIEKLANFDRERTPERVVHARGAGAYGEFESAAGFSAYTRAAFLSAAGKKTQVFVRFSTVIHPSGSPETARDPRGFATKFYTEEGNYDIVGNNLPVFFIRDAIKFPDMVHSLKPSPVTNKQDPNRFFDFFSHEPESTQMLTFLYSDKGIPANYRQMDGSGVHAFKWVNEAGEVHYVKYTWKTQQGVKNLSAAEVDAMVAKDWGHATTDLYENVSKGNYPKWDLYVQMINPQDLDKFDFNPLDATKTWPETMAKMVKVGTMTLNKMPKNFFEETEQSAFSPGNLVPGIEASEDRLLQGRLFSYFDTERFRLGGNFQQLPVNRPLTAAANYNQNGALSQRGQHGDVNYQPSEADDVTYRDDNKQRYSKTPIAATTTMQQPIGKQNNFKQAGELYRSLSAAEQDRLVGNLAGDLSVVKNPKIVRIMVGFFYQADADYGSKLAKALHIEVSELVKAE